MLQFRLATASASLLLLVCFCMEATAQDAQKKEFQCFSCDSSKDPMCITDPSQMSSVACSTSCYTKTDSKGDIIRGCLVDGIPDADCSEPHCLKCSVGQCNTHKICKACKSSDDKNCAITDATQPTFNWICSPEQTVCVSIVKDKHVERRCGSSAVDCKSPSDTCITCNEANCNVGIFPKKRLRCFQCSGSECANVTTADSKFKALPCLLYDSTDKCYSYGKNEDSIKRGCISDGGQDQCSNECSACTDDGCNNQQFKRNQQLKCVQCDSTVEKNCVYEQKKDDAKACTNPILFHQDEACYTETLANKTVLRGCLHDRAADLGECKEPGCETCSSGDGCNNNTFTCIRCRSDLNPLCRKEAKQLAGEICQNKVLGAENEKCYTGSWNDVLIRGCWVDTDARQKIVCGEKNSTQCQTCTGKNCNIAVSGTARFKIASSILVFTVVLLRRLF